jgi:predicted nucleic acid-binding protein
MPMMAAERCVIDTNVLIYSTVAECPWHCEAREWLATLQIQGWELCVTTQILREYLVILTRGTVFEVQFTTEQALQEVEAILPTITVLDESELAAVKLRDLVRRYNIRGRSIHDANVVAVMITHGLERLVTYNPDDFQRYREITLETRPT